jgi:hypothetical protein
MSNDVEYAKTVPAARAMIRSAKAVYVAIMMGNMTWAAKISKDEAYAIVTDIKTSWGGDISNNGLDVHAIGYTNDQGEFHMGGL